MSVNDRCSASLPEAPSAGAASSEKLSFDRANGCDTTDYERS
jgi:hypothetical protein